MDRIGRSSLPILDQLLHTAMHPLLCLRYPPWLSRLLLTVISVIVVDSRFV
ncbi:hypothetical protein [Mesorhizobium sp. CAU 1732]|uniref:hypothetical protein n=1 Tax=Mesorhizobium sp. CAU 1732 TaxID=3140358 RepID=UPI003261B61A